MYLSKLENQSDHHYNGHTYHHRHLRCYQCLNCSLKVHLSNHHQLLSGYQRFHLQLNCRKGNMLCNHDQNNHYWVHSKTKHDIRHVPDIWFHKSPSLKRLLLFHEQHLHHYDDVHTMECSGCLKEHNALKYFLFCIFCLHRVLI